MKIQHLEERIEDYKVSIEKVVEKKLLEDYNKRYLVTDAKFNC